MITGVAIGMLPDDKQKPVEGGMDMEATVVSMDERELTALVQGYEHGGKSTAGPATHYVVGYAHELGRGTTLDMAQACACYARAVVADYAPAQTRLGLCQLMGRGVTQDRQGGLRLLRQACEQGYAPAQCNLGVALLAGLAGDCESEDHSTEGVQLLQQSAEAGCADGQYNLALCLANGRGLAPDLDAAVTHMRRAADVGHGMALVALGTWYMQGYAGLERDTAQAIRYFETASQQDVPEAFRYLGAQIHTD